MWMIRGSLWTLDRLSGLFGSHVQQSEVFRTMIGACGPYNLDGFAIVEEPPSLDGSGHVVLRPGRSQGPGLGSLPIESLRLGLAPEP